jgi:hypothetical protein
MGCDAAAFGRTIRLDGEDAWQAAEARTADDVRSREDEVGDCREWRDDGERSLSACENQSGFRS